MPLLFEDIVKKYPNLPDVSTTAITFQLYLERISYGTPSTDNNTHYNIDLTKSDIIRRPYFYIHNNDVIIVEPNFSKVKSAGFIGSPASIASISSLLLSITLLLINN